MTGSSEYITWYHIRGRCTNPKDNGFKNYGARGIRMSDEWQRSFANFFRDMGHKPTPRHWIERIDNNGPYSADNCRWALPIEQHNNKRTNHVLTYQGQTKTLTQWSRDTGLGVQLIRKRLLLHWSIEKALTLQPITRYQRFNQR